MASSNYDVNAEITKFLEQTDEEKLFYQNAKVKFCGCLCEGNYQKHKENHAAIYAPKIFGDIS